MAPPNPPKEDEPKLAGDAADADAADDEAPVPEVAFVLVIALLAFPVDGATAGAALEAADAEDAAEAFAGSAASDAATGAGVAADVVGTGAGAATTGAGTGVTTGGNSANTGLGSSLGMSFGVSFGISFTTSLGNSFTTSFGISFGISTGFTSTTFSGGFGKTTGFSTDLGGTTGTGNGSIGLVILFFTTTGFSTGFGGSGFLRGVMTFFGGGLGRGCVMGKFSITTVSRTTRCTGAVCSNSQSNAICNAATASNAGRDSRVTGNCGAVVVKFMRPMIKAFAAKPAAPLAKVRKRRSATLAPNHLARQQSSPPWWARRFAPLQTQP